MKRRDFLISGTLLAQGICLEAATQTPLSMENVPDDVWQMIETVLEHMFPDHSTIPSAKSMKLILFVRQTLMHPSYDKDIRRFLIEGAQKLHKQSKERFFFMSSESREEALRSYEKTDEGRQWLQRIMILGMEGVFGDPVYGANIGEAGWKALGTSGGAPRPKTRYIE